MPATFDCLPQVQGCALRATRLDGAGVPQPGSNNMVTTNVMSRLAITPVYADADEIEEKNACGAVFLSYKGNSSFKRADFELEILAPDPALVELLTNVDALAGADRYGNNAPPIGEVEGVRFSLEVWAKRIRNGALDVSFPYARWVFPFCTASRVGAFTFENAATKFTLTGECYENTNWYNGPLNDWSVASDRVWQWMPVATLPSTACGYQTVAST